MLKTEVKHLLLFEDNYNVREYEKFLNDSAVKDDRQSYPSRHSLSLFCDNIKGAALSSFFVQQESSIEKLTYFGGSTESVDWHSSLPVFLERIVKLAPNLKTLVLNRYGYFSSNDAIIKKAKMFSSFENIHLVQPSESILNFWVKSKRNGQFVYSGGNFTIESPHAKESIPDQNEQIGKTKIFIHQIVDYAMECDSLSHKKVFESFF